MRTMKTTILSLAALTFIALAAMSFSPKGSGKKVHMQVTHEVKDYGLWRKGFEADKETREKAGIHLIAIYTAADNFNMVTVVCEVPNVNVAQSFINAPELKAAMEKAGVISKPEVKIIIKQE
jgi:hypothetical protein